MWLLVFDRDTWNNSCKFVVYDRYTWHHMSFIYYEIDGVTLNHLILCKLSVLSRNTWNHKTVCKLFVFTIVTRSYNWLLRILISYLEPCICEKEKDYFLIEIISWSGCRLGVMVKVLDCGIGVSKFELQWRCYVHFQTYIFG